MAKVRGRITPPGEGRNARKGASPARKPRAAAKATTAGPAATKASPIADARSHAPKLTDPRASSDARVTLRRASAPVAAPRPREISIRDVTGEALTVPRQEPPPLVKSDDQRPVSPGSMMELHWGDSTPPPSSYAEALVQRWVNRGDALLRRLAEHGVARHEYRADLKEGRFVWISPEGRVSAEAQAQVLCSYATTTSVISMGWADPLIRSVSIPRLDGMPAERDNIDEEAAWRVAMEAAELAQAEYLYRVMSPSAWYFLALRRLTFSPERASFTPGSPAGLVLRSLIETRQAIECRAEPAEIVRARLAAAGRALLKETVYAYRGTDWVARLERTGRCLSNLAERLPRESYHSIAAGRYVEEWLDREATVELLQSLTLLEDEWALFA